MNTHSSKSKKKEKRAIGRGMVSPTLKGDGESGSVGRSGLVVSCGYVEGVIRGLLKVVLSVRLMKNVGGVVELFCRS
ncbi:hypothetical protein RYX36_022364, partial [Vicia faba]